MNSYSSGALKSTPWYFEWDLIFIWFKFEVFCLGFWSCLYSLEFYGTFRFPSSLNIPLHFLLLSYLFDMETLDNINVHNSTIMYMQYIVRR